MALQNATGSLGSLSNKYTCLAEGVDFVSLFVEHVEALKKS